MRCVSYTRTTSDDFLEEKVPTDIIKQQNDAINDYAAKVGLKIDKKYSDRKADKAEQSDFQKLVKDGAAKQYDCVIVASILRCGPNIFFAKQLFMETLFPLGVRFIIVDDDFDSRGKSKKNVEDYFEEKAKARLDNMRAWQEKYVHQNMIFRTRDQKYGYKVSEDRKYLVLDKEPAAVVKEIFERASAGEDLALIASDFNKREIPSPLYYRIKTSGGEDKYDFKDVWTNRAVKKIILNPIYKGEWERNVGGCKEIWNVEPIVSEEVFEMAGALNPIEHRAPKVKKANPRHVFSRRIVDKQTGKKLYFLNDEIYGNGGIFLDFEQKKDRFKPERDKFIAQRDIEEAVKDCLRQEIRMAKKAYEILNSENTKAYYLGSAAHLIDLASDTSKEQDRLIVEKIKKTNLDDAATQEEVKEINQRIEQLEVQLVDLSKQIKKIKWAFTLKNPWVLTYKDLEVPKVLNRDFINKYIFMVQVENLKKIEVILKGLDGKEYLPEDWFENIC